MVLGEETVLSLSGGLLARRRSGGHGSTRGKVQLKVNCARSAVIGANAEVQRRALP